MATAPQTTTRHFPTHIDIPADKREPLVERLNHSVATTFDLMSQTKQAHWNVKGKDFYQLHLLFDESAEELSGFVDRIAERVTSLGGYALGTARVAAEHSALPEYPTEATSLREGIDEAGRPGRPGDRRPVHRGRPRGRQAALVPGGPPSGLSIPAHRCIASALRLA